jgi:hypothetical protein
MHGAPPGQSACAGNTPREVAGLLNDHRSLTDVVLVPPRANAAQGTRRGSFAAILDLKVAMKHLDVLGRAGCKVVPGAAYAAAAAVAGAAGDAGAAGAAGAAGDAGAAGAAAAGTAAAAGGPAAAGDAGAAGGAAAADAAGAAAAPAAPQLWAEDFGSELDLAPQLRRTMRLQDIMMVRLLGLGVCGAVALMLLCGENIHPSCRGCRPHWMACVV